MVVKKQRKQRMLVSSAALALVSGMGLSGCGNDAVPASHTSTPEVEVVTLQPQNVALSAEFPGRTSPYMVAEVRPQVGGILLQREFEEGAEVNAGEVLYRIESAPYRAVLAKAEASFESAQQLFRRYEQLVKVHAISQQQYDDARAAYLQAKALVESARIDMGYTTIKAPIAGRVGRSKMTQGALVTSNQPEALATIQQLDPIYVDIVQPSVTLLRLRDDLASGRIKNMADGQAEVLLTLENGQRYEHTGRLQFSEVSVDQTTGAVTLRAEFPNPDGVLLPGMFVRAQLQEGIRENVLLVPQRGVTRDSQGQAIALVLDENNIVQQRSLETGRVVDGQWVIEQGLNAGDRVVVAGLQHVRPGATASVATDSATEQTAATREAQ